MNVGENIRSLRKSHHLRQAELAKVLGVTDSAISAWEKGITFPRLNAVERLAKYFNVPISHIVGDTDYSNLPPLTPRDEEKIADDLERMLTELNSLSAIRGNEETAEDRELLKGAIHTAMKLAKRMAKRKFTPLKLRK